MAARLPVRWVTSVMAAAISIAIHFVLLDSVLRTERGRTMRKPPEKDLGASASASEAEVIGTLILIEEPHATSSDEDTAPRRKSPTVDDSTEDRAERAALFGRYLGQIHARVQRAWMRPAALVASELFECRVQLQQNTRGDVMEVALDRCGGDTRWHVSLVQAIERASPLPAPPDPRVFAESLQLLFRSEPEDTETL